jgi:hypothetical protein
MMWETHHDFSDMTSQAWKNGGNATSQQKLQQKLQDMFPGWCASIGIPLPISGGSYRSYGIMLSSFIRWNGGTDISDILIFLECLVCYIKIIAFLQAGIDYLVTYMRFLLYAWVEYIYDQTFLSLVYRLCKGHFLSPVKLATHLRLNFQPLVPKCTREPIGSLGHHCPVIVFTTFPMWLHQNLLMFLLDAKLEVFTQIQLVTLYSVDAVSRSSSWWQILCIWGKDARWGGLPLQPTWG